MRKQKLTPRQWLLVAAIVIPIELGLFLLVVLLADYVVLHPETESAHPFTLFIFLAVAAGLAPYGLVQYIRRKGWWK